MPAMVKKGSSVYSSLSSSSSSSPYRDPNSVFKLLPVTILALASALPPQDQEVLAYMITRSISAAANPLPSTYRPKSRCKKGKIPVFQCECFDCYTSFWHRWDSSPNRDLIHQAIEAFEEHLMKKEVSISKKRNRPSKKKDKGSMAMGLLEISDEDDNGLPKETRPEDRESEIPAAGSEVITVTEEDEDEDLGGDEAEMKEIAAMEMVTVQAPGSKHKGLARKFLPDVVGLFNSRLWSLWVPSI